MAVKDEVADEHSNPMGDDFLIEVPCLSLNLRYLDFRV